MNKKLLLAIFSGIIVGNMATINSQAKAQRTQDEQKDISELLYYHFDCRDVDYSPFESCRRTASQDCDLVITHLKNARELHKKSRNIYNLKYELKRLSSEEMRQTVQNRLEKAQAECPNYAKAYWQTLSSEEQDALIDAAAKIAEKENHTLSHNIDELEKALNL